MSSARLHAPTHAAALRRIAAERVEIGRTHDRHRSLPKLAPSDLEAEVPDSANQLQSLGLPRPRLLSYPYGHTTPEAENEIHSGGYAAAFTVTPGTVSLGMNRYALPP